MRTLYCWALSKEILSTILKVFGMTRTIGEHSTHQMNEPVIYTYKQFYSKQISLA